MLLLGVEIGVDDGALDGSIMFCDKGPKLNGVAEGWLVVMLRGV